METQVLKPQRLKALVLNSGGHAFDTRTGRSYGINATAQVAILMLQDGASRDEVIGRLMELCAEPESVVAPGIDAFLEQMMKLAS
jgi:hypothetical protein